MTYFRNKLKKQGSSIMHKHILFETDYKEKVGKFIKF